MLDILGPEKGGGFADVNTLELTPELTEVVDLSVEADGDSPRRVGHRLGSGV